MSKKTMGDVYLEMIIAMDPDEQLARLAKEVDIKLREMGYGEDTAATG